MAVLSFRAVDSEVRIDEIHGISLDSIAVIDGIFITVSNAHTSPVEFAFSVDDTAVIVGSAGSSHENLISGICYSQSVIAFYIDFTNQDIELREISSFLSIITNHANCVISGSVFLSEKRQDNLVGVLRDIYEEE